MPEIESRKYLNIQEQVEKNKNDICELSNLFTKGLLKIIGVSDNISHRPEAETQEIGDVYVVIELQSSGEHVARFYMVGESTSAPIVKKWNNIGTFRGEQGPKGSTGLQGEQGNPGLDFKAGVSDPDVEGIEKVLNQVYLNVETGIVYQCQSISNVLKWTALGSIAGVQGPQGNVGPRGIPGPQGQQGIQGLRGPKGDSGEPLTTDTITSGTVLPNVGARYETNTANYNRIPEYGDTVVVMYQKTTDNSLYFVNCRVESVVGDLTTIQVVSLAPAPITEAQIKEFANANVTEINMNLTSGEVTQSVYSKVIKKNNELNIVVEGRYTGQYVIRWDIFFPDDVAKKIYRYDGMSIYNAAPASDADRLITQGLVLIGASDSVSGTTIEKFLLRQAGGGSASLFIFLTNPITDKSISLRTTLFLV